MKQIKKLSVFKLREGMLKSVPVKPTPKILISAAGFDFYLYRNVNGEYAIIESITGQSVGYISKNKEEVIRIANQGFDKITDNEIRNYVFQSIEKYGFIEGYHMNHIPIEVQQKGKITNLLIKKYQRHIERLMLIEPDPFMMEWGTSYPNKPLENLIFKRDKEGLEQLKYNQLKCLWEDEVYELNHRSKFLVNFLKPDFKEGDYIVCNGQKGIILEIITYDWFNDFFWYLVDFEGVIRECVDECFVVL